MGIRDCKLLFSGKGWPQGDVRGFVCRRKVRLYSSVGLLHVSQDVWKGGEIERGCKERVTKALVVDHRFAFGFELGR
jgi:hypothetical protein